MTDTVLHTASSSSFPPSDWVETTLGEVCEIIGGGTPKTTVDEYWNGDIPWLSVVDFNDTNRWVSKTEKTITEKGLKESSTKILNAGDLIISARGTVGALAQLKMPMAFNQSCYGIKEKERFSDKNFLFYLIKQSLSQIGRNVHGAVFDTITRETFNHIQIALPPLPEQVAIASVLSAFDDKIELLREQNKTLEEMGQVIFQEWFGKYGVDDELPEGWRVGNLGEVGQIVCGKTPSKENQEYFGGEIPFIKIPDMHGEVFIVKTEDSLTELGANTQKNKFIPKQSICVSCIATVGLVSITSKDSQTNQQINSIIPNDKKYLEYLYFVLTNMKNDLIAIGSGGSATLNINTSTFSNIEIMIPNEETLNNFHNAISPIFTKILDNLYQIQSLARSRDALLPKLMSGVVRVNDFSNN